MAPSSYSRLIIRTCTAFSNQTKPHSIEVWNIDSAILLCVNEAETLQVITHGIPNPHDVLANGLKVPKRSGADARVTACDQHHGAPACLIREMSQTLCRKRRSEGAGAYRGSAHRFRIGV